MKTNQWLLAASLILSSALANATTRLHILSEDRIPVANAEVLVGTAEGSPFAGNLLHTDQNGYATVPADWKAALPVTITASQFIKTTFTSVEPIDTDLQLHKVDPAKMVTVGGDATDFGDLPKDGQVDFGLVFPAMAKRRLMQFNVAELISSEYDTIKIITETLQIPSNVTLPNQKESYILPITLNKPAYRMQVRPNEDHRMTAIHGQFPLKKVADAMRAGKSFLDVVNDFKFINGGQLDVAASSTDIAGKNIPVNQFAFDNKVGFTAPSFAGDQVSFAIAMVEKNGLFIPSDLKRLESGETRELQVPAQADSKFVASLVMPKPTTPSLVKNIDEEIRRAHPTTMFDYLALFKKAVREWMTAQRVHSNLAPTATGISLALTPAGTAGAPAQIGIVAPPQVQGSQLVLQPPPTVAAVTPVATYVTLAQIETKTVGNITSEKRTRLLEFFSEGWASAIDLPDLTTVVQQGKKYRFEVLFLGRDSSITPSPNDYFLDEITHVSRNAYDF